MVFLALPLPNSPNSIWRKFKAVVQNAAPGRAPRGVARHGTWRHGTARHGMAARAPPLPLYLLAGVTHKAYFYGLYHFAFLECALPGVNQRPQFGQCNLHSKGPILSDWVSKVRYWQILLTTGHNLFCSVNIKSTSAYFERLSVAKQTLNK